MAICTVRDQDNKCLQDPAGQSPVHTENVLHDHEPPEPGQRGLRPGSRRLRSRSGVCADKGGCLPTMSGEFTLSRWCRVVQDVRELGSFPSLRLCVIQKESVYCQVLFCPEVTVFERKDGRTRFLGKHFQLFKQCLKFLVGDQYIIIE